MKHAFAIVLLLLATACNRGERKPVCIVTYGGIMETFPLELAQDLGFFREAGVEVNIERTSKPAEAVLGGSCDMDYDGFGMNLQTATAGRPLQAFMVTTVKPLLLAVVSPQKADRIRSVADLKGALFGVSNFGSVTEVYAKHLLRQHGLESSDVTFIAIGSGGKQVAALEHGKVDAAFVTVSAFAVLRRRAPGVRVLMDPRSPEGAKAFYGAGSVGGYCLSTKAEWLARRPDDARKIAAAMARTLRWIREHPAEEVYAKMQPIYHGADKEVDMETLRSVISAFSPDGRMPPGAAEAMRRMVSAADENVLKVDLATTYTNEFLEIK